jgi:hypothetical protein
MSLEIERLNMARDIGGGLVQAQCPACAEKGRDKKGEHLRVYPDGRFGCCVYPKDGEHRKRIFALVGDRKPRTFTVRVAAKAAVGAARSVRESLFAFAGLPFGTLGTGNSESRAYAREEAPNIIEDLKDWETCVPSVPKPKLPYMTPGGDLVIPFEAPERYHWWNCGQSVRQTAAELMERKELDASPF